MRVAIALLALPLIAIPLTLAAQTAQTQSDTPGRAITQPLRDTGISKQRIAEVLLLAASAPYSSQGTRSCALITAQIRDLDQALGQDIDQPAKRKGEAAEIGAAAARTAVNALIPGLGIVRIITGADKAQRRAEAAVYAGSVRRGYLKGIGLARGCRPPASPLTTAVKDVPEIVEDEGGE